MGFNGDDIPSIRASAWYVAGTWALTGERKHGRVEPHRDFLERGLGAFELVGRYEKLRFNDATYPGAIRVSNRRRAWQKTAIAQRRLASTGI